MQSITLQSSDSSVIESGVLGRLGFAASSESDGADSVLVAAIIEAVAEGNFTQTSNATSLVFSTASSSTAEERLKITSEGHFVPFASGQYDLGSPNYHFRNIYADNIIGDYSGQLDGNLDLNGYDIVGTGNITIDGDVEANQFIGNLRGAIYFTASAGEALTKGDVVYISGISGNKTVVSKADANDSSKMPAFGIAAETVNNNANVNIITFGSLYNIDTDTPDWDEGDELYVSNTAGVLTKTAPTGESSQIQKIAKVTRRDNSAGSIKVMGAGRSNATPNLNEGRLFVGNSSNQAVADGTIHVDISNSRVGIGTTDPYYKLEIDVGSSYDGVAVYGTNEPIFRLVRSGYESDVSSPANGVLDISADTYAQALDSYTKFSIDGSEKARLNATGFGIGTSTNVTNKLQVEGGDVTFNDDGGTYNFRVEGDADQNLLFVQGAGGHDNVAIGTNTPLDTAKFQIQNQGSTAKIYSQIIGGNNKGFGLLNNQSVIETLNSVNGFYSYMFSSTNGAVTDMYHFRVDPPSGIGTITSQRGFYAGAGLQYATNNYGFVGNVPQATNNYNLYMGSSAKNYFNGDVGIGTASPQAKLDVNGTVEFDDLVRWEYPDKSLDTSTSTLGYMRLYDEAGAYCGLGVSTSSFNVGTSGAINLRFVTDAVERIIVGSNGNTVINELGHPVNFRVEGDADENLLLVKGAGGADKVGVGTASLYGKLNTAQTTTNQSNQQTFDIRSNNYSTSNGQYYTFGEYIYAKKYVNTGISDTGYTIGTEITSVLADEGSLSAAYGLRTYAGINNQSDNGNLTAAYGVQSRVINYSQGTGNINTARGIDVYINGDLNSPGNGGITNAYGVYIQSILNSTNTYGLYQVGSSDKNYFAGDVGIGTTSPLSKLHVRDTIDSDCQIVVDNGTARAKLQTLSNICYAGTITDHDFVLRTNNTTRITLSNSSDQGLVLVNPLYDDQDFEVRGASEDNLIYVDAGANNVGIGIGVPTQRLHVYEAGNAQVLVDDGTVKTKVQSLAGQSKGIVGTNSNHDLEFRTNNNGKMIIKAGGDVGIGTPSPSYKLDVNGTFSANSINVNDQFTFPTTDGSADQVLVTDGNGTLNWEDKESIILKSTVNGRLTLTSSTPVTTSDVTNATIYWTPYNGNDISLYYNGSWRVYTFSQLSQSITDLIQGVLDTGTYDASTNYDVFIYYNGTSVTWQHVAWTNNTTRATALALQDGVYVKSGDSTKRYVGTFRTDNYVGAAPLYLLTITDNESERFVWNYYNQVNKKLFAQRTFNHSYTSLTKRAWGNITTVGETRYQFVIGLPCFIRNNHLNLSKILYVSLGIDSTTSDYAPSTTYNLNTTQMYSHFGSYDLYPDEGFHFIQAIEHTDNASGGSYSVRLNGELPC
jgi:hypothetical protein